MIETHFFFPKSRNSTEKKKNMVKGLKDGSGEWVNVEDKIKSLALEYFFKSIFCKTTCKL